MSNSYTGKYLKDVLEGVQPQMPGEMIKSEELVKSTSKTR
jgi:hypothetical protein